jgi:hypothetical protein
MNRIITALAPRPINDVADLVYESKFWVTRTEFRHGGVDVIPGIEPHCVIAVCGTSEFLGENVTVA